MGRTNAPCWRPFCCRSWPDIIATRTSPRSVMTVFILSCWGSPSWCQKMQRGVRPTSDRPDPQKRVRLTRGFGTSAASRAMKYSGYPALRPSGPPCTVKNFTLLARSDRDLARLATLGPTVLQDQLVTAIGVARHELDGFFSTQSERLLQFEAHADVGVGNLGQRLCRYTLRLACIGHELPIGDPIVIIGPPNDVLAIDLVRPPAQRRHAVLDGGYSKRCVRPMLHQSALPAGGRCSGESEGAPGRLC